MFGDLGKRSYRARYQSKRLYGLHHYDRVQTDYFQGNARLNIEATSHSKQSVSSLHLVFTLDDWATRQELEFEKADLQWDTLSWGWLQTWKLQLQAKEGAILRYYIYANLSDGSKVYADNQVVSEMQATQFAQWLNPRNLAPTWSKTARVYQVFVDRFNPGMNRDWLQTQDLLAPFGGTLRGVIEKLNHIHALGFNTILLTPIFSIPSHHGYDISHYTQI